MGSHAFDYSIWEKNSSGSKEDKNRHEQRIKQKQKRKKHDDDEDEWGEWDD